MFYSSTYNSIQWFTSGHGDQEIVKGDSTISRNQEITNKWNWRAAVMKLLYGNCKLIEIT